MKKCKFPDGVSIKPDGIHELDPCVYRDVKIIKNATVIISECENCGHVDFSWKLQDNSEEIDISREDTEQLLS